MSASGRIVLGLVLMGCTLVMNPATAGAAFSYGYTYDPIMYAGAYSNGGQEIGIAPQGAYPGRPFGVAGYGENNYWFIQNGNDTDVHISGGFVSSGANISTACGVSPSPSRYMEWKVYLGVAGCTMGGVGTAGVEERFAQWCQYDARYPFPQQNGYWYNYWQGQPYLLGPLFIGELYRGFLGGQTSNALATAPRYTEAAARMGYSLHYRQYQDCGRSQPLTPGTYPNNDFGYYYTGTNWLVPGFAPYGWTVGVRAY